MNIEEMIRDVAAQRLADIASNWRMWRETHVEIRQQIGRELHTLKGELGFGEHIAAAQVVHDLEELLAMATLPDEPAIHELFVNGIDLVTQLVASPPSVHDPLAAAFREKVSSQRASTPKPRSRVPTVAPRQSRPSIAQLTQVSSRSTRQGRFTLGPGDTLAPRRSEPSITEPPGALWSATSATVRVQKQPLERLGDLVADLQWLLPRVQQTQNSPSFADSLAALEGTIRALDTANRALRLVPLRLLWDTLPSWARNLARGLEKQVDVNVTGGDIEIDRYVLEELRDVFILLIQNAIDHGVQVPNLRALAGKPPIAAITLEAALIGDNVRLRVSDDGNGIDVARVRERAVSLGLLPPAAAATLDDAEVLDCLFADGFSTKDDVTELSGRGVGLAVVKSRVLAHGGDVHVTSVPGHSTTFEITLPTGAVATTYVSLRVGSTDAALLLSDVFEVLAADEILQQQGEHEGCAKIREHWVPLVRLDEVLGVSDHSAPATVIVVAAGDSQIALLGATDLRMINAVSKLSPAGPNGNALRRIVTGSDGRQLRLISMVELGSFLAARRGPQACLETTR